MLAQFTISFAAVPFLDMVFKSIADFASKYPVATILGTIFVGILIILWLIKHTLFEQYPTLSQVQEILNDPQIEITECKFPLKFNPLKLPVKGYIQKGNLCFAFFETERTNERPRSLSVIIHPASHVYSIITMTNTETSIDIVLSYAIRKGKVGKDDKEKELIEAIFQSAQRMYSFFTE